MEFTRSVTFCPRIFSRAFRWQTVAIFLITIVTFFNVSSVARATILQFDGAGVVTVSGSTVPPFFHGAIQYIENGMTVDAIGGGIFEFIAFPFNDTNSSLAVFTTDGPSGNPFGARFSFGGALFDVLAADTNLYPGSMDQLQFVSSLGSIVIGTSSPPFPINGHIDFTQIPGWRGITFFDMTVIKSGLSDNPFRIDNLVFQVSSIPEPSTLALLSLGFIGLVSFRRRRKGR